MECRLGEILKSRGHTQRWFAKRVGISETSVSLIVKGGEVKLRTALRIAKELDMHVEEIWRLPD